MRELGTSAGSRAAAQWECDQDYALKNHNRTVIHVAPGAPYGNPSYDWTPVWYVGPC
ncbi:hypothetical protein HLK59_31185 [Streptomyces sp. S3(2020)]|uniref:hypothetical protein n=1 Tax=Streptomyces sp. S3(2020) TaxID=2732044 RepID=UPI00148939B1|nr:hypothetical protein [Streptomyces sp. S3(2020)]NNN34748.1 hypothetical protein [Streptomyces sp. S3(2020)]